VLVLKTTPVEDVGGGATVVALEKIPEIFAEFIKESLSLQRYKHADNRIRELTPTILILCDFIQSIIP
jgi:hypothetical protein